MKTEQIALISGVGILAFIFFNKNKAKLPDFVAIATGQDPESEAVVVSPTTSKPTTASSSSPKPNTTIAFPLKRGSKGEYVRQLQSHLKVSADGLFGTITETALYQRYGIKQINTLSQLQALLKTSSNAKPTTTKPVTSASSTPTNKPITPTIKVSNQELDAVFNAIYRVYEGYSTATNKVYKVNTLIDTDKIVSVLGKKSDDDLRLFRMVYGQYHASKKMYSGVKLPTLLNGLLEISEFKRNVAVTKLITRVRTL